MCLVLLVYIPLLATHTSDFLSNIIKRYSFVTIYVSLFKNSQINTLELVKAIPAVHDELYSLSELYWGTSPGLDGLCAIGTPW